MSSNKPEDQIMKGQGKCFEYFLLRNIEKFMKVKMDAQEAANLYRQNIVKIPFKLKITNE